MSFTREEINVLNKIARIPRAQRANALRSARESADTPEEGEKTAECLKRIFKIVDEMKAEQGPPMS